MIPAIYNWQPCRVCGLPVPAGETGHRECSERVRTDEPAYYTQMEEYSYDPVSGEQIVMYAVYTDAGRCLAYCLHSEDAERIKALLAFYGVRIPAAQEARGDE